MKFRKPSKLQSICLPMILRPPHKALIAEVPRGHGKTSCLVLGLLSRIDLQINAPQAVCVCPTRELALKHLEVLQKMGKYTGATSYAAVPIDLQNDSRLRDRSKIQSQVVIGTAGTVKRLMSQKRLDLSTTKMIVFDDVNDILEKDGFPDDCLRILKAIRNFNAECQVLLFFDTLNVEAKEFAAKVVTDYNRLILDDDHSLESVKQFKLHCANEQGKIKIVWGILEFAEREGPTVIFVNSEESQLTLSHVLQDSGYSVTTILRTTTKETRKAMLEEFKAGLTTILITTDDLAPEFDEFDERALNLVINYDVPSQPDYECYLRRNGRPRSFERKLTAFNLMLAGSRDDILMEKIEGYFGTEVTQVNSTSEEDVMAALGEARLL